MRFGARDYAPEMMRWTARDPSLFAGGTTNLYEYCLGDPVNRVDREGRQPEALGTEAAGVKWVNNSLCPQWQQDVPSNWQAMPWYNSVFSHRNRDCYLSPAEQSPSGDWSKFSTPQSECCYLPNGILTADGDLFGGTDNDYPKDSLGHILWDQGGIVGNLSSLTSTAVVGWDYAVSAAETASGFVVSAWESVFSGGD